MAKPDKKKVVQTVKKVAKHVKVGKLKTPFGKSYKGFKVTCQW